MARVLLFAPPYLDLYGNLKKAAGRYFPLGIGYIASYLRAYGNHDVRMYEPEAQRLSLADVLKIIIEFTPDIIGITCSTPNYPSALALAKAARQNSHALIILGGAHVSALPEHVLESNGGFIDCVVVGEGEATMLDLADAVDNKKPLESVKGIVFKKDGLLFSTGKRPFIEDIDLIPFPARDLIPQELFYPNLHNARHRRSFSILTSRGCPFNCSFCAARIVSGTKYRMHSAEYVLTEMEILKNEYGARQLIITDDTFTMNRERLERICQGMIERRLELEWFCFSQVNTVEERMLELMVEAGCFSIGFGVESSCKKTLARMGKPISPEQSKRIVAEANKIGIKTQAFYVLGNPGETKSQMEDTIRFSMEVNATLTFYNMLVPFPGTRDFRHFFSSKLLKDIEWGKFVAVGQHCVASQAGITSAEIENLIGKAYIRYYCHIGRLIALLQQIKTFYELSNYIKGGIPLLRQIGNWVLKRVKGNIPNRVKDHQLSW